MATVQYCTREDLVDALDTPDVGPARALLDRAISAATADVHKLTRRTFAPWKGTAHLVHDVDQPQTTLRLPGWAEAVSLDTITDARTGTVLTPADWVLESDNGLAPYTQVRLTALHFGANAQLALAGTFGRADDRPNGALSVAMVDTTAPTLITLSGLAAPGVPGVGDLLLIGTERVQVTAKTFTSATTLSAGVPDGRGGTDQLIPVASVGDLRAGDVLLIDAERMRVEDVTATALLVRRAWAGTSIAAHLNGATVYAARGLIVDRAQAGTTAAAHDSGTAVSRHHPEPLIRSYSVALAINTRMQEQAGYARTVGTGDNQREAVGKGLEGLRAQVIDAFRPAIRASAV